MFLKFGWFSILCCLMLPKTSSWMFGNVVPVKCEDPVAEEVPSSGNLPNSRRIPFEIKTMDDRFLTEANFERNMSPLDNCHHQIMAELEGTCSDLSEEDIAKLSVRLLNCQCQAERRQTYSCTSEMSIAECTAEMDSTTWNAYQIVSNRARAVCYAVRQQQFRQSAEQTVNRLVDASQQQLSSLNMLYEGQEVIRSVAEATVEQMRSGHKRLLDNQAEFERLTSDIRLEVVGNLQELRQEKELIASTNKQLLGMTGEIQKKLEETAEQITVQSTVHSDRHNEVLQDLVYLGNRAEDVSSKLDRNAAAAENFQLIMERHHLTALNNLERINSTVNYLLSCVDSFRLMMDSKLEWVLQLSGKTDDKISALTSIVFHFLYFLVCLAVFSMLHLSVRVRYLLFVILVINAVLEVKGGFSFGLADLTMSIAVMAFGDFVWAVMCRIGIVKKCKSRFSRVPPPPSVDQQGELSQIDLQYITAKFLESLKTDLYSSQSPPSGLSSESLPVGSRPLDLHPRNVNLADELSFSANFHSPPPIQRLVHNSRPTPKIANPPPTPSAFDGSYVGDEISLSLWPFKTGSRSPRSIESVESSPARSRRSTSRTSTPMSRRRSSSRASSVNRSISRPLCEALTKTGQPCKLPCQDFSNFCYRHQSD